MRTPQNAQYGSALPVMPFIRLVFNKPPEFLLEPPQDAQHSILELLPENPQHLLDSKKLLRCL